MIRETRKIIPPFLEEVAAQRQELPKSLEKIQKIINDVKKLSVVGGVEKGVDGITKEVIKNLLSGSKIVSTSLRKTENRTTQ